MDPMRTWKWLAAAVALLTAAQAAQAHTVQEETAAVPGFTFAYTVGTPTGLLAVLVPDDGSDGWIGAGTDDPLVLVWLMTDGQMGSGGNYAQRMRTCMETGKIACKPAPVCWAIYSESGGPPEGPPSTTSCLVVCKDGSNPCPPPPSEQPPGKVTPIPGDG